MAHKRAALSDASPRPPTKAQRTRAAIIDAGCRLFLRQGYAATSMRQIADEVGLALGAAYNHFPGKEDIFIAIVEERHPFLEILPAMQAAQGDTIDVLVRDAATRMLQILEQRQDVFNLMFIELVEFKGKHIARLTKTFFPPLMTFAQRFAQARGPLRPIPLLIVVRSFLGLFFSYFMTETLMVSQLPPEAREGAFDHFVDIYLHGILE
jgi:AcrR family transcriptional regulator